ncbi:MAG: zinc-ribbon domain-containing protein [Bacteroidaceae bacterium]|nr:zinc-ribbon domain-containing protein [Bacteroidaceae bacterium]
MPFCKYCGKEIRENAKFCVHCGKSLSSIPGAGNTTPPPSAVPPPPPSRVSAPAPPPAPSTMQQPPTPVVEQPVATPVVEQPAATPVVEHTVVAPVVEQPVATPVVEQPAATPVVEQPAAAPVVEPVTESVPTSNEGGEKKKSKVGVMLAIIIPVVLLLLGGIGTAIWYFVIRESEPQPVEEVVSSAVDNDEISEDVSDEEENITEVSGTASSLSTEAVPTDADFNWYLNKAMKNGKPKTAVSCDAFSSVEGSWKVLLYQDPTNKYGVRAFTYATATFTGTEANVIISLKRHSIRFTADNKTLSEEEEMPDDFSGKWKSGKLIASGVGSMTISSFWQEGGKQYAIGTFDSPDGIPVSMAMVRP